MAWFSFGKEDLGAELRDIKVRLGHIEEITELDLEADMATNDELATIKASLVEAATEIPAKLDELLAAIAAGDPADPQLVSDIKELAQGLADIVPNPEPTPDPEPPTE